MDIPVTKAFGVREVSMQPHVPFNQPTLHDTTPVVNISDFQSLCICRICCASRMSFCSIECDKALPKLILQCWIIKCGRCQHIMISNTQIQRSTQIQKKTNIQKQTNVSNVYKKSDSSQIAPPHLKDNI